MEGDISASKSPEELFQKLGAVCRACGQVEQIQLCCHKGTPRETICFIDMKGDLNTAARHINGTRMGNSSLYKILCLPPDFRCAEHPAGEWFSSVCRLCRAMGSELSDSTCATPINK